MLRYKIKFPFIVKCVEMVDIPLRSFLLNRRSVVSGGSADVLDCFIENLTRNKGNKWKIKKKAIKYDKFQNSLTESKPQLDGKIFITEASVDEHLLKNINSPKLTSILNVCLHKRVCPSRDIMVKLAHNFARCGNKECIDVLLSLSKVDDNTDLKEEGVYRILKAEAIWRSGESSETSLNILWEVYKELPALRRHVRSSLRVLLAEVILNRGEASLIQAKKFVLQLASPPFEDYMPLSFLWARCILSECYADQQLAVEMVEECKENELFKKAVGSRVDAVIGEALLRHQTDAVYRLLEALLRLSMDECSQHVLEKLFDYKYLLGDMLGCDAVLKACDALELDVGYTRRKQLEKVKATEFGRYGLLRWKKQNKEKDDRSYKSVPKFRLKL